MDTCAIDHICCSFDWFNSYNIIDPISIKLPNGNTSIQYTDHNAFHTRSTSHQKIQMLIAYVHIYKIIFAIQPPLYPTLHRSSSISFSSMSILHLTYTLSHTSKHNPIHSRSALEVGKNRFQPSLFYWSHPSALIFIFIF